MLYSISGQIQEGVKPFASVEGGKKKTRAKKPTTHGYDFMNFWQ